MRKGGRKGDDMTAGDGRRMLTTNNGRLTKDDRRWMIDDVRWTTTMTLTNTMNKEDGGSDKRR